MNILDIIEEKKTKCINFMYDSLLFFENVRSHR